MYRGNFSSMEGVLTGMKKLPVVVLGLLAMRGVAQETETVTVTVPAGTPITVATVKPLVPSKVHVGDPVELKLVHPMRVGTRVVAPEGTAVTGHVTAVELKPVALTVAVDPMVVRETPVAVAGNPMESKKGKLTRVEEPQPKELEWHFRLTAGETAAVAGVGLVALPLVAVASPFLLYEALHGNGMKPDQEIGAGHRAVLKTTEAVVFPVDGLVEERTAFAGPPVIFFADRMYQKNGKVSCGTDPLLGPKHPTMSVLRVAPRTYTFATDRGDETKAVVEAKVDERYLVYHDHAGLHAVGLMGRPDLVERLPKVDEKTVFLFDTTKVTEAQQEGVERDLARGGCGVEKQLHVRGG